MAITTYIELKAAVSKWADISSDNLLTKVDDLVTIAETRIFRETKTRSQETALSSAIVAGVVAVPSDYESMKYCYIDGTPVQGLERRSPEWIYATYGTRSGTAKPGFFAREASNFIFAPYASSGYTMKGVYYKRLGALSTTAHALFTGNPDLYLFACLAESEIVFGRDDRIKLWEAKYQKILADVNGFARAEEVSGSTLRVR